MVKPSLPKILELRPCSQMKKKEFRKDRKYPIPFRTNNSTHHQVALVKHISEQKKTNETKETSQRQNLIWYELWSPRKT